MGGSATQDSCVCDRHRSVYKIRKVAINGSGTYKWMKSNSCSTPTSNAANIDLPCIQACRDRVAILKRGGQPGHVTSQMINLTYLTLWRD